METIELNNPKQELKKAPEYGHDLLNLSAPEMEQLKSRIEKWKGLVRMFVHPMYEKWRVGREHYADDPKNVELLQIEDTLAKLLAMPEDKTPPMIILEEAKYVKKLESWLKENPQGNSQNGVYFVETLLNQPEPKIQGEFLDGAWKILSDKLTELGVKKILMGGMQLEVSEFKRDWTHRGPWVARCVGIALSKIKLENLKLNCLL